MQTDYLQFVVTRGSGFDALVPLIQRAMYHSQTSEIVDLCSGGTGPWLKLQGQLTDAGVPVQVLLTDKYPDPTSIDQKIINIKYLEDSIDALSVPENLTGMRTIFEGFHHFTPDQAQTILQDAYEKKVAIGIFEATFKPSIYLLLLLLSPLLTLLGYLFVTPFLHPRSFSRFFWTYILPLVPLATCWDGVISMLRTYSQTELQKMTEQISSKGYTWEIGSVATGTPIFNYIFLIGYPDVSK